MSRPALLVLADGTSFDGDAVGIDGLTLSFALGEALAHAEHLVGRGSLVRSEEGSVVRFERGSVARG